MLLLLLIIYAVYYFRPQNSEVCLPSDLYTCLNGIICLFSACSDYVLSLLFSVLQYYYGVLASNTNNENIALEKDISM